MSVSPDELEEYLQGMIFPASKSDLRTIARCNQAPDVIIDLINNLPERRFDSPVDIGRAIEDIE